jgi:hypothetical protein
MTQHTIAFLDLETSGLDPQQHDWWEAAIIRRAPDGTETTHLWQRALTELHLAQAADPKALEIGRYWERRAVPAGAYAADMLPDEPKPLNHTELAGQLRDVLDGAIIVGSNPGFDLSFLTLWLDASPWHYRPVDIATLAAGYVQGLAAGTQYPSDEVLRVPYSSRDLSRAVGVQPPGPDTAHTALGDATWARDVYDAVARGRS